MSTLKIMAIRHSAFYTPFLMTMAGGFIKKQGYDYEYRVATPDNTVLDNMLSGDCDLAQSAVATGFDDISQGIDRGIRHFAQINQLDGFFIASRKPVENFDWSMLKGKTVLVDHFFQPCAMLRYALAQKGMSFDDFEVIDAGDVSQIEQQFRNGIGDFVHLQGPAPQQLEFEHKASVVASVGEVVGNVAFSSICATRDWLKTDAASAFGRAYRESLEFVKHTQAAKLSESMQEEGFFPEIEPRVLSNTIATYQALGNWNHHGEIRQQEFQHLLEVFGLDSEHVGTSEQPLHYSKEALITTLPG